MSFLHLSISSLGAVVADDPEVLSLRAEDASGSFGILSGHADFLTALGVSIVSWRGADGAPGYCAVRNGILTVSHGTGGAVATREGHVGDDLGTLEHDVLARYRERRYLTTDEARPEAVARRAARGHRTARANIADLVDDGSFVEYGSFAIAAQRRRRIIGADKMQP